MRAEASSLLPPAEGELVREDIETGPGDAALVQRRRASASSSTTPPRAVLTRMAELFISRSSASPMTGPPAGTRHMHGDEVCFRQGRQEPRRRLNTDLPHQRLGDRRVVGEDAHAEGACQLRHLSSDASEADHQQRLALSSVAPKPLRSFQPPSRTALS